MTTEIKGADDQNPEGDGSGEVTFKATAENAIRYTIRFDGNESAMINGSYTMVFDDPGVNSYSVEISAYNSANAAIRKTVSVEVRREYVIPAEFLTFLTGNDKKQWRVKSETVGHLGGGPKTSLFPEFYEAQPFEKDNTGMYDDQYIFKADKGFTHETNSFVFGKADPLSDDYGSIPDAPSRYNSSCASSITASGGARSGSRSGVPSAASPTSNAPRVRIEASSRRGSN